MYTKREQTNMQHKLLIKTVITLLVFSIHSNHIMAQNLPAPKLIEEVKKSDSNSISVPYKKYEFPNGLTVILHEDHSDPIVYVDVTYHVGSARETPGRSGFAHFFEHMMFQGSDHVGDEKHFAIVTEAGGTLNGTTNRDRTNYFETMPSNHLETALWLEADRMGYLLDAVTTKKFEIQRATVKNERGQNYDNRPYGLVFEKIGEALYPFGHPYSWTTIGYLEDIDKFELEELKNFFLRWYGPNNATLTIAGHFDEFQALEWIAKYFGNIPRGPEVQHMDKIPAILPEDRYISYEDNITFPYVSLTFPSAPSNTKEEVALDALAYLMGGGDNKNSLFYQRFVKTQKAMQASVYNPASELAGQFMMSVVAFPNEQLKDIEKEIREIIDKFDRTPINQEIFDEYVASEYANLIYSLQSVQRKGSLLAFYETFTGNPAHLGTAVRQLKELTPEDVRHVFEKYIKNKPAVVLSVYSKDNPSNIVTEDNYKRPEVPENFKPDLSEYDNLKYIKGKDDFDRSVQPKSGENPVVQIPEFWHKKWSNGIKVIGTSYEELPLTNITIKIKAGQLFEPIEKAGISEILAALMTEGTKNYSSEEFQSELKKIGSRMSVRSGISDIIISATSLNEHLDRTIHLLNELLFEPRLDENEFELIKSQQIQAIQHAKTQASTLADMAEARMIYSGNYILSRPSFGNEESISNITLQDVKKYYSQHFAPNFGEVIIVGSLNEKTASKKLSKLRTAPPKNKLLPPFIGINTPEKTTIVFTHKDKSPQSQIKVVGKGLRYDGLGDYYQAGIANFSLGGAFNSRININLRERKGWTYGARSGFAGSEYIDKFIVSTSVKADHTDSSVVEIMKELNSYVKNGIAETELEFTKNSIGQRDALKYETASQKASFMSFLIKNDFDKNLVQKQTEILENLRKSNLDDIIQKYINPDRLYIVVVGDKDIVLEPLKKLGYPLIEINPDE